MIKAQRIEIKFRNSCISHLKLLFLQCLNIENEIRNRKKKKPVSLYKKSHQILRKWLEEGNFDQKNLNQSLIVALQHRRGQ